MDKRKLAAALALGGSIAIGSLFMGGGEPISGSYRGGYYGGAGSYGGGAVSIDTFRLLIEDYVYPNEAAETAGWIESDDSYYDQVRRFGASGSYDYLMYGHMGQSVPAVPWVGGYQGIKSGLTGAEDSDTAVIYGWVAFNVGDLTDGHRVEEASLLINTFGAVTTFTSGYMVACLDTNLADYAMLNNIGWDSNDSLLTSASWDKVDYVAGTDWNPLLSARDDTHDWGPRGIRVYPPTSIPANTAFKFDITDPLQQVLDYGMLENTGGWIIVRIYNIGSPPPTYTTFECTRDPTDHNVGNPALVVTTTSQRGPQAWGGGGIPFVMTFDDNWYSHDVWYESLNDSGLIAHALVNEIYVSYPARMDVDSLILANTGQTKIIHHTAGHSALGWDRDGYDLDTEIGRWWMTAEESLPLSGASLDTTGIVDFAWAVNDVDSTYSIEAIERMIDFGFRSSRGAGVGTWTPINDLGVGGTGLVTHISWDAPVNMMMYAAYSGFYGTAGSALSEADMRENLTDRIDLYYTSYGRAALIGFGHNFTQDGITTAGIEYITGLVNELNGVQHMSLDEIMSRRDGTRIDPADIAEWTGAGTYTANTTGTTVDSVAIFHSAAIHDSLINLTGHDNLLEVWVAPKGD